MREGFQSIRVSSAVMEYIRTASKRVCELFGRSLELYFYLLTDNPREEPARVSHVYLPWGQRVDPTSCSLSLEGKLRSYQELEERGFSRVGWAHSHGGLAAFHSLTDDGNTLARTHDSGLEMTCESSLAEEECEKIVGFHETEKRPIHLLEYEEKNVSVVRLQRAHYTYSIVVSIADREPYGVVGVREADGTTYLLKDLPIEEVEGPPGEGAVTPGFDGIDEELLAKIDADG